jgi:hypothetical protein
MMSPVSSQPLLHLVALAMNAIVAIGSPMATRVASTMWPPTLLVLLDAYVSIQRHLRHYTGQPSSPYPRLRLPTTIEHRRNDMVTCCDGESEGGRSGDS